MELIVISNPNAVANESNIINQLFKSGLKYFHIRKPDSNINVIRKLLNEIDIIYHNRIALHQFHELKSEFEIKKLHFTEIARSNVSLEQFKNLADKGFTLSTSIHDVSMLPELSIFNYVFYGPVFDSLSKPGYLSNLSDNFKIHKTNTKPKVMALGGVQLSNLLKIKAMGFHGAAVLGTIWNEPWKAVERFKELNRNLPV